MESNCWVFFKSETPRRTGGFGTTSLGVPSPLLGVEPGNREASSASFAKNVPLSAPERGGLNWRNITSICLSPLEKEKIVIDSLKNNREKKS